MAEGRRSDGLGAVRRCGGGAQSLALAVWAWWLVSPREGTITVYRGLRRINAGASVGEGTTPWESECVGKVAEAMRIADDKADSKRGGCGDAVQRRVLYCTDTRAGSMRSTQLTARSGQNAAPWPACCPAALPALGLARSTALGSFRRPADQTHQSVVCIGASARLGWAAQTPTGGRRQTRPCPTERPALAVSARSCGTASGRTWSWVPAARLLGRVMLFRNAADCKRPDGDQCLVFAA
jgi:hypothetical protein